MVGGENFPNNNNISANDHKRKPGLDPVGRRYQTDGRAYASRRIARLGTLRRLRWVHLLIFPLALSLPMFNSIYSLALVWRTDHKHIENVV